MFIEDAKTGEKIAVVIEKITSKSLKSIKSNSGFGFDWKIKKGTELYQLRIANIDEVLGLMRIIDHVVPETNAIEISLLETKIDNVGKQKKYKGITGALIAYACREAFKRDHDGYVFLIPKSDLINHYQKEYGFTYIPPIGINPTGILVADDKISREIIKKYMED